MQEIDRFRAMLTSPQFLQKHEGAEARYRENITRLEDEIKGYEKTIVSELKKQQPLIAKKMEAEAAVSQLDSSYREALAVIEKAKEKDKRVGEELKALNEEKKTLDLEKKRRESELVKLQTLLDGGIEEAVMADRRFWPKGFEELQAQSEFGKINAIFEFRRLQAPFLFSMPDEFLKNKQWFLCWVHCHSVLVF